MVPFNVFDAAIYVAAIVAVVTGFSAGFIRSAATIVAYLAVAPIAAATMSLVSSALVDKSSMPGAQSAALLLGTFLLAGITIGKLLRLAIDETFGPTVNILDRVAGALLGAARVALVAITVFLSFDLIIPAGRQPAFLNGSKLRPLLSNVAQSSLKSLPPDIISYIDGLKRERRI